MAYTRPVEGVQGAADALDAVVHGVVGGGGAAVVAGGGETVGHLGRRPEERVAGVVGARSVHGLHVAQRHIGGVGDGTDAGEHRPEVVSRAARVEAGALDDRVVGQYVAGGDQGETAEPRRGGGRMPRFRRPVVTGLAGGARGEDDGQDEGRLPTACDHHFILS